MALSHFYGISREPRLVPEWSDRGLELVPHYDLIHQSGLELQATLGAWLWKLEAVHRVGKDTHNAVVGGFEYTFYGVGDSRLDLGVLGEYLYDDRPADFATPFQGDIMAGLRLSLNDPQSSQGLLSVIFDPEEGGGFSTWRPAAGSVSSGC